MNPPSRQALYMDIQELPVQNDKHRFIADCIDITTREVDEDATRTGRNIMEKEEHYAEERLEKDEEQPGEERGTNQGGGDMPPLREVPSHEFMLEEAKETDDPHTAVVECESKGQESPQVTERIHACHATPLEECEDLSGGSGEPPSRGVPTQPINCEEINITDTTCLILPVSNATDAQAEDAIFTCDTDPFMPARVAKIQELVQISEDLMEAECREVEQLIEEFANCFALSLSKVNLIPGAVHKLIVPEGTMFCTKIPQCSLNPDQ